MREGGLEMDRSVRERRWGVRLGWWMREGGGGREDGGVEREERRKKLDPE